jgi:hypothetical protein
MLLTYISVYPLFIGVGIECAELHLNAPYTLQRVKDTVKRTGK